MLGWWWLCLSLKLGFNGLALDMTVLFWALLVARYLPMVDAEE